MTPNLHDYYDANMMLLKTYHPDVYTIINDPAVAPVGEIVLAPNGKLNLRAKNVNDEEFYLHEQSDPEAEVNQFLDNLEEDFQGFVSLVGFGLGYAPLGILKNRPEIRHFAIFDIYPGIFKQALRYMDLSSLLSDPRVTLGISESGDFMQQLSPITRILKLETIKHLTHNPSLKFGGKAYDRFCERLFSYYNEMNVEGATTLTYGNRFVNNRLLNLTAISHHYLLEHLHNAFAGIPAILVASGPSLDKNIHLLAEAKGKAVIIAVDSALLALLANGIIPDFLCSIDPTDFPYEKVASVSDAAKDISLICMPWVGTKMPKIFPAKNVFWCYSANNMEKWISSILGGKIVSRGAGTVAHLNYVAALMMGCSPIVFVGQDLAYSGSKSHASHTVFTARDLMERTFKSRDDLKWVKGVNGEDVPTDRAFYSMKKVFESMIENDKSSCINATEGGAHIEGTEILTLKETLNRYCRRTYDIPETIEGYTQANSLSDTQGLLTGLVDMQKKVKNLEMQIDTTEHLLNSVDKGILRNLKSNNVLNSFRTLPDSIKEKLQKIDAANDKLDKEQYVFHILDDITMKGLKQSDRMQHQLREYADSPEKYLHWLTASISRVKYVNTIRKDALSTFNTHLTKLITHHEQEKRLLKIRKNKKNDDEQLLKLVHLYFESGDLALVSEIIEDLSKRLQDSAEVFFYQGVLAGYQGDYEKAEKSFNKAVCFDKDMASRIEAHRRKRGDEYCSYKKFMLRIDRNVYKKMLIKGFRICPDHETINSELRTQMQEDLGMIKAAFNSGNANEVDDVITSWLLLIEENKSLIDCLTPVVVAEVYGAAGSRFLREREFSSALKGFSIALEHDSDKPEYHIGIADALFGLNEFEIGIEHLKRAVLLDRNYAKFWENIGDNLQKTGQQAEAITAYEQCFINLPQNIGVLKKMGDCYQQMGELSAAQEAYRQFDNIAFSR